MRDIDWNATGTWAGAIATLVGAIATLGAWLYVAIYLENIKIKRQRPKLILNFKKDGDVTTQLNTAGHNPTDITRWVRIGIEAVTGRKSAKGCRAYLVKLEQKPVGEENYKDITPTGIRPLPWEHGKEEYSRDLLPGFRHRVDLLAGIKHADNLNAYFVLKCYPNDNLRMTGDYILTVQVSAEDAEPVKIEVPIRFLGNVEGLIGLQDVHAS